MKMQLEQLRYLLDIKKIFIFIQFSLLLFACSQQQSVNIVITGNGKGNVDYNVQESKGIPYLVSEINRFKMQNNCIHLDIGNQFFGTAETFFSEGIIFLNILNSMDITCGTFGSLDFEDGSEKIFDYIPDLKFPLIITNLNNEFSGCNSDSILPYKIITNNGIKIALLGMVNPDLLPEKLNSIKSSLVFALYQLSGKTDLIIIFGDISQLYWEELFDFEIPALIVVNDNKPVKENYSINQTFNRFIHFPEATNNNQYLKVKVDFDRKRMKKFKKIERIYNIKDWVEKISFEIIPVSITEPDEKTIDYLVLWNNHLASILNKFVFVSEIMVSHQGNFTSPLGNFLSDLLRKESKTDISVFTSTIIHSSIPQGTILEKDIFKIFPYTGKIIKIEINGADLRNWIQMSIKEGNPLQVSGINIIHTRNQELQIQKINGEKINNQDILSVSTTNNSMKHLTNYQKMEVVHDNFYQYLLIKLSGKKRLKLIDINEQNRYFGFDQGMKK